MRGRYPLVLHLFQSTYQRGSCEKAHMLTQPASGQSQRDGQMRFTSARAAQQTAVVPLLNPAAAREFQDLRLGETGHSTKVERIEILEHGEAGLFNARLQCIGTACGQLQLGEAQQIFQVVLVAVGRLSGELHMLGQLRRQPERFQVRT